MGNGRPIGSGRPGPIYDVLLKAWSQIVNLDIAGQMQSGAIDRKTEFEARS
jgi:hypothetical protein